MADPKRFVLIACAAQKLDRPAPASALYTSTLFRLSYGYALSLEPSAIYILSAKHGLLSNGQIVAPYNVTLNDMGAAEIRGWARSVLDQMRPLIDMVNDEVVMLAGDKYRRYLMPHLPTAKVPLEGLRIGEQLHYLSRHQ